MFRKARQRHNCPRRHTRPCHVLLSTSWRLAFGGWHARLPPLETWLVSNPSTEAPILAPSPPARARLGHGLRSPVPHLARARLQRLSPACALSSHPPTEPIHSALPASLSLVSPMPLTPLDTVLSTTSVPGAARRRHTASPSTLWAFSAPAPGMQCHAGPAWPQAGPTAASLLQKSLEPTACGHAPLPPGDVLLRAAPHTAPSFPLTCPRGSRTGRGGLAGAAPIPATKWIAVGEKCSGWGPC